MLELCMENFIALSPSSKKALHVAKISAPLPINILIYGEVGVGKKLLTKEITQNTTNYEAIELEQLIQQKNIDLQSYKSIIIFNIENILNSKQFFEKLKNIKIIATANLNYKDLQNNFPVKIKLEALSQREEDLNELIKIYTDEANKIYLSNKTIQDIKIDISQNGLSLKKSIFKSILLNSITKDEMIEIMYNYFMKELENKSYKDLLEIFEIPLLKASKKIFKSQVQMAKHLDINRITLRKKLNTYFEGN